MVHMVLSVLSLLWNIYKDGCAGDARHDEECYQQQSIKHERHLAPLGLVEIVGVGRHVTLVKLFVDLTYVRQQIEEQRAGVHRSPPFQLLHKCLHLNVIWHAILTVLNRIYRKKGKNCSWPLITKTFVWKCLLYASAPTNNTNTAPPFQRCFEFCCPFWMVRIIKRPMLHKIIWRVILVDLHNLLTSLKTFGPKCVWELCEWV